MTTTGSSKPFGEIAECGPASVEAAVVVGEEQIRVRVVADDPVVEPAFDDRLGRALEEVLRLGPRLGFRDVGRGGVGRVLRLVDQVPLLLRREVEDLRRAVVAGEVRGAVE